MKTTERYTGTVEHDGVPAHDCRRITDVNRKTSLTFCSRCGDWFEPVVKCCPAKLKGYERIDGGTATPVSCTRPIGHDGLHADQFNGNPIEWPQNASERPHGVIDIQYGNDPKPFRKVVENDLKSDVMNDLLGAAKMLDQALSRLHPSLELYKSIKEVDEALDSVRMSLEEGDYDKEAK